MKSGSAWEAWAADDHAGRLDGLFRDHYHDLVRLAAMILRDGTEAEDVVQEVLWTLSSRGQEPRDPLAWLRRAVANAALNRLRSLMRRRRYERRAPGAGESEPSPEEIVTLRESARQVREALGRLPRRQVTVLLLRHSGLSYAEVARAVDVPVNQVGTMLRRAELRFREVVDHDPS